MKENQEKKERARRRIAEEKLIHERRDEEIDRIQIKILKMSGVKDSLENSVNQLKMYEVSVFITCSELVEIYTDFSGLLERCRISFSRIQKHH